MNTDLQPHQAQIQRAGKILWGFSWVWLVLNALAFVIVIITTMALGLGGNAGAAQEIVEAFSTSGLVPDVSQDALRKILAWDFQAYLDNLAPDVILDHLRRCLLHLHHDPDPPHRSRVEAG